MGQKQEESQWLNLGNHHFFVYMFARESDVKMKEIIFTEIKRKIFIIRFRSELFKMDEQDEREKTPLQTHFLSKITAVTILGSIQDLFS